MFPYLARRAGQTVIVLVLLSVIVFLISRLSGSPVATLLAQGAGPEQVAALKERLGLDQPLPVQYWRFVSDAVQGDFGTSTMFHTPAMGLVLDRLPATVLLAATALIASVAIGMPIGTMAALKRGGPFDRVTTAVLALGQASPTFWVGILLILVFGVKFRILPFMGNTGWESVILPAVTLAILPTVTVARVTRSSAIGVLGQDYVVTARAKGIPWRHVIMRHVLKNSLIPVITIIGFVFLSLLSGAVITEQIFSWPGIGALAIEAVNQRDYAVIQAVAMVTGVLVVILNLVVDLSYFALDPRIRRSTRKVAVQSSE